MNALRLATACVASTAIGLFAAGMAAAGDNSGVVSTHYDGVTNDLLTAGLGKTGLGSAVAPGFADALHPTAEELRRLAIYNNYRALIDPTAGGGYGTLYGPNVTANGTVTASEGRIAGTEYIAYRIPAIVIFLAFASADVAWDKRYLPAAAVLGILGLRTIAALSAWAKADAEYRPMLQALEGLPSDSAIYTGVNYQGPFEPLVRMPWSHFDAYAAIRNRLFVKGIWADPTQNWIVPTPRYAMLANLRSFNNRVDRNTMPMKARDMFNPVFMANYDFLLVVHVELYRRPIPPGVRMIARSGNATLFSLHNR